MAFEVRPLDQCVNRQQEALITALHDGTIVPGTDDGISCGGQMPEQLLQEPKLSHRGDGASTHVASLRVSGSGSTGTAYFAQLAVEYLQEEHFAVNAVQPDVEGSGRPLNRFESFERAEQVEA